MLEKIGIILSILCICFIVNFLRAEGLIPWNILNSLTV